MLLLVFINVARSGIGCISALNSYSGVQTAFRNIAMRTLAKRQQAMMNKMMGGMGGAGAGQNPFADLMRQMQDMQNQQGGGSQYHDSSVIDGEAREVTPDHKKIEHKNKKLIHYKKGLNLKVLGPFNL